MGEVYRARDTRLNRDVAVKLAAAQFSDRAAREARLAAALNHPNICHVYDVGPNYLVMEVVEGPTLAERLTQGRIELQDALDIARQLTAALEAAHEKGIVHRDLKPANIKIRPDGAVKVLDFGLAKLTDDRPTEVDPDQSATVTVETRTGVILGTAGYMAPEQARGLPVDKRADIFAFGVVLYEMLTGQRLFQGGTLSDTLAAVLTREPDWNRVPPAAERLLRRCLERDPKQRLRDIGDALFLLEDNAQPAEQRSSVPWKLGAAAATLVACAALGLMWLAPRQAAPAAMRLSVDLGDNATLEPNRANVFALSPDGSRVVFTTGQALRDSHLALRRLDQTTSTQLPGTEGAEAPFFSPDGKSVAFFAAGKLKRIDIAGGPVSTLCDAPTPRGGSWGDDDTIVFAATNRGGLFRVPAGGGTQQPITTLAAAEYSHRYPQMLPGSRAVLFTNSPDGNTGEGPIEVVDLQTRKRKIVLPLGGYARYLPGGFLAYMSRGTLFVARMDPDRLAVTGSGVPVLEDVMFRPTTGCAGYAFSQTGMLAYVAVSPDDHMRPIGIVDEKGRMELLPLPRGLYSHPRISPDGSRLAVTVAMGQGSNVWIYEMANQRLSRLAFPAGNTRHAVWSPDGKYLVLYSDAQQPGPGIYCARADGIGTPIQLVAGAGLVPQAFLARTGQLLYEAPSQKEPALWVLPVEWSGSAIAKAGAPQIVPGPQVGGPAGISSDGRWLAYGGGEGTPEVFVRPYPGLGGPWQISAGGISPFWSAGAHELFYRSLPDFRVMVAGYSVAGDSFVPARPRPLSDVRVDSLDLMPDGRRVVVIPAAVQKDTTHAIFVMGFGEDLKRRVK
jgi:hypothetical protein